MTDRNRPWPANPPPPEPEHPPGVAVFCGARPGNHPAYAAEARKLGSALARRRLRLLFGGGTTGLMGAVAEAVQAGAGPLAGIVPAGVFAEDVPRGAGHLLAVQSLRERKSVLRANADILVALAGGIGTLDEVVEAAMERQLDRHRKEIILVDTRGCWQPLLALLDDMVDRGFLAAEFPGTLHLAGDAGEAMVLIDRFLARRRGMPPGDGAGR